MVLHNHGLFQFNLVYNLIDISTSNFYFNQVNFLSVLQESNDVRASEMSQRAKRHAIAVNSMSQVPRTYVVEGQCSDLHMYTVSHECPPSPNPHTQ